MSLEDYRAELARKKKAKAIESLVLAGVAGGMKTKFLDAWAKLLSDMRKDADQAVAIIKNNGRQAECEITKEFELILRSIEGPTKFLSFNPVSNAEMVKVYTKGREPEYAADLEISDVKAQYEELMKGFVDSFFGV